MVDRQQNYKSLYMFSLDYDGLLPHPIGGNTPNWNPVTGNRYSWNGFNEYGASGSDSQMLDFPLKMQTYRLFTHPRAGVARLEPLGILAAFGYVYSP